MSNDTIIKSDVDEAFSITQNIINEFGPRLPGSESSNNAAKKLYEDMSDFDKRNLEDFKFAPNAFFGFFNILVISYIISTIFMFFEGNWIYLSTVIALIGIIAAISQFVFYWGWFDIFYKKTKGYNVIGDIEPDNPNDIKQEIIVCGHHDSCWTITFVEKHAKLYSIRLITALVFPIATAGFLLIWMIWFAISGNTPFFGVALKVFAVIGIPIALQLMFYKSRKSGSLGAGDNLISCAMAVVIGKKLANAKKSGNNLLKNTRVRIISFGAEEAATKGSQAYAKKHKEEFSKLPTYALCPDCLYKMKDFCLLTSDQNTIVKSSEEVTNDCNNIAIELGYSPKVVPFTFGGGATDSAPLARNGVKTTIIMGMSTELMRDDLDYHTPRDTPDKIDHELIEASMKIMLNYILKKDKEL